MKALPPPLMPELGELLHLEERAFSASTVEALGFSIVNETSVLAPFRQAALFLVSPMSGRLELRSASGLVSVAEDTPYAVWLSRLVRALDPHQPFHELSLATAQPEWVEGWQEWLPEHVLAVELAGPEGTREGLVLYARDEPWQERELNLIARIHETYGYCLHALARRRPGLGQIASRLLHRRWLKWIAIGLIALAFVPVRLSALAPAEVVALGALAIATPQDGVIGTIHVQPNALVKAGDKLFSLDDRGLESRREVAVRALATARADMFLAQQRAFEDLKSKGDLATAIGRVKEKEAELELVQGTLERVTVRAPADGVAIFGDPNDWIGKPVQTGERVMQLADPRDAGVLAWLPVADAINLDAGAPMKLFLHTNPLAPLSGSMLETSYQATLSPAGVASYRVRGRFDSTYEQAHIGLRGTVRISGQWTVLGYYLFRRPMAAVREWTGL